MKKLKNSRRRLYLKLLIGGAFAFVSAAAQASPPPGVYELYNGAGQKTGLVTSSITSSGGVTLLSVVTELAIPGVATTYKFVETESVSISSAGVTSFRRESNEDGRKSFTEGNRDGKTLVVRTDRNGAKLSTAFPLTTFDITEFEIDLPNSPFRKLKPGQSKALRVLYFDRMAVVPVSRNVSPLQTLPTNDGEAPVLILNSVVQGKSITSWFHATTGELLQEEGPDYLMTRFRP